MADKHTTQQILVAVGCYELAVAVEARARAQRGTGRKGESSHCVGPQICTCPDISWGMHVVGPPGGRREQTAQKTSTLAAYRS